MTDLETGRERADASERPGGDDRLQQRAGRDLVLALHSAIRTLKLYPLENQAVQKALTELQTISRSIAQQEGIVTLRYIGDFCFVNDLRLRIDLASYATFGAVGRVLRTHDIGQIEAVADATVEEWTRTLALLIQEPDAEEAFASFTEELELASIQRIKVAPVARREPGGGSGSGKEQAKATYAQSVAVAREAMLGLRMGRAVSVRRVKRSVQKIVDQVLNNESSIIGMTVLRDYDQYTFAHSVNVAIFSIALGKKLGLSKLELYELGLGALMHDIGKVRMPIELTTKEGHLEAGEWEVIREHPTEGLLTLLEMQGSGEIPLRTMLAAYEHHMKVDLTGYPSSVRPREPTLFARIVAIADGFDAATTKRSYQDTPWLPDAVLREMQDNTERGFDRMLVQAFISMTGFYPVGSVVVLDNYELAIVMAANHDRPHQPVIKVLFDEMGMPLMPPRLMDLSEADPATGTTRRTIIKTTDPERYGINVKEHFV